MMMTCKEATEMSAKLEEGKLSQTERVSLWFHMLICKYCKAFEHNSKLMIKSFQKIERIQLSTDEKERMQKEIDQLKA